MTEQESLTLLETAKASHVLGWHEAWEAQRELIADIVLDWQKRYGADDSAADAGRFILDAIVAFERQAWQNKASRFHLEQFTDEATII